MGAAGFLGLNLPAASAKAAAQQPSGDYQIGIYTRPWDQHDYRVALDAIAEAGFKHAGLMTTKSEQGPVVLSATMTPDQVDQVAQEIAKRNLEVPSVYGGRTRVAESLEALHASTKYFHAVHVLPARATLQWLRRFEG